MKSFLYTKLMIVCCGILLLMVESCEKKSTPPEVKEWELYQDPFYGFELQYPKGWRMNAEANKVTIYSSQEVATRFFDPSQSGPDGVEIIFGFDKFSTAGVGTLDNYKSQTQEKLSGLGEITGEQPTTFAKESGQELSYKSKIDGNTTIFGKRIIAAKDSVFYYLNVAGFNEAYTSYQFVFDTIFSSLKLPKPKAKITDPNEAVKPSQEFTRFVNDYIEMQYPDNFTVSYPQKKGEVMFAVNFQGLRNDCNIFIDAQPAKKASLDKVFDENKGKFKPKTTNKTTIDGNEVKYLGTSPASNIDRRVYFLVKNDIMYRIILTWYKPMSSDFLSSFEQAVSSLKIKK